MSGSCEVERLRILDIIIELLLAVTSKKDLLQLLATRQMKRMTGVLVLASA